MDLNSVPQDSGWAAVAEQRILTEFPQRVRGLTIRGGVLNSFSVLLICLLLNSAWNQGLVSAFREAELGAVKLFEHAKISDASGKVEIGVRRSANIKANKFTAERIGTVPP